MFEGFKTPFNFLARAEAEFDYDLSRPFDVVGNIGLFSWWVFL